VPLVAEVIFTLSNRTGGNRPRLQLNRHLLHTVASREATEEHAVDEKGQPSGADAWAGSHGTAERGTVAHPAESTWSSSGAPESSLEALAASWRQSGASRAAAGAARVDSGQVEPPPSNPPPVNPPLRGRAEVRAPYADLLGPPPAATQPQPGSNGGGYSRTNGGQPSQPVGPQPPGSAQSLAAQQSLAEQATNGNGTHYVKQGPGGAYFSSDPPTGDTGRGGHVTPPGSPAALHQPEYADAPAPEAHWPSSYHPSQQVYYQQPMYYQEPRHDEPRHDEPRYDEPRYEEPRYDEPRYEEPRYEDPRHTEQRHAEQRHAEQRHAEQRHAEQPPYQPADYQPGQYQPSQYHQYAQQAQAPVQHIQVPRQAPPQDQPRSEPAWREALPQRVPAPPDVPEVPEDEAEEPAVVEGPAAETPELARIATKLREGEDEQQPGPSRPDGFDIPAVLAAVRGFPGVRDAQVRPSPGGVHTLRLELADDADPARVSREIARLLKVKMGLAAEPNESPRRAAKPAGVAGNGVAGGSAGERPSAAPVSSGVLSPSRDVRRRQPAAGLRRAEAGRAEPVSGVGPGRGTEPDRGQPGYAADGDNAGGDTQVGAGAARPLPAGPTGPRVVLDQVEVSTQGLDAVVQVRLTADGRPSYGVSTGPAVDGYVVRLSAVAAASALDEMLVDADGTARARCFVEHAAVVPLGSCEVAVVVLLLVCGGWVEQLTGSALVAGDPRQAMVRATLAAVNRRLEALLP
jgi:hypothetical protein